MERLEDQETQPEGRNCRAPTITPVFRTDGSGDTYIFTDYLSKISPKFRNEVGCATTVGFQSWGRRQRQLGLTTTVKKTPGAIGYIAASYLIAAGLGPPRSRTRRASSSSRT